MIYLAHNDEFKQRGTKLNIFYYHILYHSSYLEGKCIIISCSLSLSTHKYVNLVVLTEEQRDHRYNVYRT